MDLFSTLEQINEIQRYIDAKRKVVKCRSCEKKSTKCIKQPFECMKRLYNDMYIYRVLKFLYQDINKREIVYTHFMKKLLTEGQIKYIVEQTFDQMFDDFSDLKI